jgi:catechol 2,3-dioxygenase-like lactoylglutathione lyase family enzyme
MEKLASCSAIAFVPTTNLSRARAFYEKALGLRIVEQNTYACVAEVGATMLRITAVDQVANPGYTVLGWSVADIDATISELQASGVNFVHYDAMAQDANGVWTTPGGDKVAWFNDPDGNILS